MPRELRKVRAGEVKAGGRSELKERSARCRVRGEKF